MQYVIRPHRAGYEDYRGYAGTVAGGVFKPGDDVVVLPSGLPSRVASIDTYNGPVTEALMAELNAPIVPVCPAFPENQRTLFNGYLFVGQGLLSESSMRNHPLTPMHDANLVRVMQRQCHQPVGLVDHRAVHAGTESVKARLAQLQQQGTRIAIVDAVSDEDLMVMGRAFADLAGQHQQPSLRPEIFRIRTIPQTTYIS